MKLNHPNLVNVLAIEKEEYMKNNGKAKTVDYIILEYVGAGELFDYISATGVFDEGTARFYFR